MAGSLAGADSWFANPASQVSAHFGVGVDGTVHQYVRLATSAWANGIKEPGHRWPWDGNPNSVTVSIETEDFGNGLQPVTDSQYAAVLGVCRMVLAEYPGITHIATHASISPQSRPHCPGNRWIASGRFHQLAETLGLTALV